MNCTKCNREPYSKYEDCIFHCDKEGWIKQETSLFWSRLECEKDIINGDYTGFVFPKHRITNRNGFFEKAITFKNVIFLGKVDLSNTVINDADFSYSKFYDDLISTNPK